MSGPTVWQRLFGINSAAATGRLERPDGQRWGRVCPHCKGPSKIRSSQQVTPVYSEQLRVCENPFCGHVWIDGIEAVRTLSPSGTPDAEVAIPISRHIRRDQVAASLAQTEQLDIFGEDR
jgi:hypothetical protein